ncbi:MAG: holo-ACP synthase [Saccharofermentanales bacterium]
MKCGIDIINENRIKDLISRRGTGNLTKIWTLAEIRDCTETDGSLRYSSLAARYAAKEAVCKAFGTGFGRHGVRLDEIETLQDALGAPYIKIYGTTEIFFKERGFCEISVSLSHDSDICIAMCIVN